MAAQRIRAAHSGGLPRCRSEGTLIDLSDGFSEASFNDVKGELVGTGLWPRDTVGLTRTLGPQGCPPPACQGHVQVANA